MSDQWESRIVGSGKVSIKSIEPHPANPRKHSDRQRALMRSVLDSGGYVAPIVVSKRSHRVLDGHLRLEVVKASGKYKIDVVWVDVTPEEELLILATFDAIGSLAALDAEATRELRASLGSIGNPEVEAWLAEMVPDKRAEPVADGATSNRETDAALPEKSLQSYLTGEARQIVLLMSGPEYEFMSGALDKIADREKLPTQAAVLLWLVERFEGAA